MTVPRNLPRLLLLAGIGGAIALAVLYRDRIDLAALDAWLSGFGFWAPAAYLLAYAAGTVAFLPGSLFALAGGALFGPVWGAVLNLLGATIGAGLAFLAARYIAGYWVERKAAGWLKQLVAGVEAEGWRFVALLRLVPLFPFNLTNYALGLTRIGFLPYVLTSLICMAPGAIAYTWLGHAGREALEGDATAIRYGLLALGLLAAIAFLPRLLKRLKRAPEPDWIEPEELQRQLSGANPPVIVDVRGSKEFAGEQGSVPGSVNISLPEIGAHLDDLRETGAASLVIVCLTDKRSAEAARTLESAGFESIAVLRGGVKRWNELGFENARRHGETPGGSNSRPLEPGAA